MLSCVGVFVFEYVVLFCIGSAFMFVYFDLGTEKEPMLLQCTKGENPFTLLRLIVKENHRTLFHMRLECLSTSSTRGVFFVPVLLVSIRLIHRL